MSNCKAILCVLIHVTVLASVIHGNFLDYSKGAFFTANKIGYTWHNATSKCMDTYLENHGYAVRTWEGDYCSIPDVLPALQESGKELMIFKWFCVTACALQVGNHGLKVVCDYGATNIDGSTDPNMATMVCQCAADVDVTAITPEFTMKVIHDEWIANCQVPGCTGASTGCPLLPLITNSTGVWTYSSIAHEAGSTATLSCITGYMSSEDPTASVIMTTCEASNQWSKLPACIPGLPGMTNLITVCEDVRVVASMMSTKYVGFKDNCDALGASAPEKETFYHRGRCYVATTYPAMISVSDAISTCNDMSSGGLVGWIDKDVSTWLLSTVLTKLFVDDYAVGLRSSGTSTTDAEYLEQWSFDQGLGLPAVPMKFREIKTSNGVITVADSYAHIDIDKGAGQPFIWFGDAASIRVEGALCQYESPTKMFNMSAPGFYIQATRIDDFASGIPTQECEDKCKASPYCHAYVANGAGGCETLAVGDNDIDGRYASEWKTATGSGYNTYTLID